MASQVSNGMSPVASFSLPARPKSRTRLLVLALILLVDAMAVFGTLSSIWSKAEETVRAQEVQNDNLATSLQEQINRLLAVVDQSTVRLGDEVRQSGFTPADYVRIANETGLTPTILTQLSWVGSDGIFVGSNLDPQRLMTGAVDLSAREHVRAHLDAATRGQWQTQRSAQGLFVGRPVLGKVSGKWTVQLSRAVYARTSPPNGQATAAEAPLGVVVASLNPTYLEGIFAKVKLGEHGGVSLVGLDGTVRAQVLGGQALGIGEPLEANSFANSVRAASLRWSDLLDPNARIFARMTVGEYPLTVYVHVQAREVLADWRTRAQTSLVLCALFCAATLVGAFYISRSILKLQDSQEQLFHAQREALESQRKQVTLMQEKVDADLSLQHELEERRRAEAAQQEAEASNKSKSEFLALMTHELRTPMSGVVGMLTLALKNEMSATQRQQIALARYNAESLLTIVNDLLDLSKIEAGKMDLERIDYDLPQMLHDSTLMLRERADQLSLGFHLNLEEGVPRYVVGDPTRLRQVLINLLGNALKFTESGSVSVNVTPMPHAPVTVLDPQLQALPWCRFEVVDTGIGMSKEALGRMFQKFEQADTSTTRKFGGTGLGLSICKLLVELMGGQIGVDSELGKGTAFWFAIPLPVGQEPQVEEEYQFVPHARRLKVLVAEDVPTNQIIIESMLQQMGHEVKLVENGLLAVQALSRKDFDVVLMDGRMPVMDGLEASRRIRSGGFEVWTVRQPQIPIVALTANASKQDRQKFLQAGTNVFLTKPVNEVELHRTLADVIANAGEAPPSTPLSAQEEEAQATLKMLDDLLMGSTSEVNDVPDLSSLDALLLPPEGAEGSQSPPPPAFPAPPPKVSAAPASASSAARNAALQAKMLATFKEQLPQRLQEIEAAMTSGDWNTAAIVVHGIKGSVAYIWPDSEVYHLAAEMEKMADSGQTQAFVDRFGMLQSLLAELQNA